MSDIYVVFEYTEAMGPEAGIRIIVNFSSEEAFLNYESSMLPDNPKQVIVAKNVSKEEAIALANETPIECYVDAAFAKSIDQQTGFVDPALWAQEMGKLEYIINNRQDPILERKIAAVKFIELIAIYRDAAALAIFGTYGQRPM